jgi:ketosteroid isomerase-like protein
MSQERIESVLATIESWNAGEELDLEGVQPDFEIISRLSSVQGKPYKGHDGILQWRSDIDEQFTQWRIEMDEVRDLDGNRYLGLGRVHLRGRGSGAEFDQPLAWLFELRDGKWSRMSVYANAAEALDAAGLAK